VGDWGYMFLLRISVFVRGGRAKYFNFRLAAVDLGSNYRFMLIETGIV